MTPDEHHAEAERLLGWAARNNRSQTSDAARYALAEAQLHIALATDTRLAEINSGLKLAGLGDL